jgi:excisionase family DNA binding protein
MKILRVSHHQERGTDHASNPVEPEGDFVSVPEAARMLGVHQRTACNWVRDGTLAADASQVGKNIKYRVKKSSVEQLVARRKK